MADYTTRIYSMATSPAPSSPPFAFLRPGGSGACRSVPLDSSRGFAFSTSHSSAAQTVYAVHRHIELQATSSMIARQERTSSISPHTTRTGGLVIRLGDVDLQVFPLALTAW